MLSKLTQAVTFEQFLQTKYVGISKRRADPLIPLRDQLFVADVVAVGQSPVSASALVQVFRIGDLRIFCTPGELFNDLGTAIKEESPGDRPWVAAYCNDYIGYISTRMAHEAIEKVPLQQIVDTKNFRKYYGTTTSPFAPEAGELLVDIAVELMDEI